MRTWLPLADSVGPTTGTPTSGPVVAPAPAPAPAGGATAPATQGTATTSTAPTTQEAKKPPTFGETLTNFLPFILLIVVFYFFLFRGRGKEERARRKQLETLKRGDEVQMIGGLIGKVVEVRDDRVVIKVDEANNVKETYLKSAIHRVLDSDEGKKEDTK